MLTVVRRPYDRTRTLLDVVIGNVVIGNVANGNVAIGEPADGAYLAVCLTLLRERPANVAT